VLSVIYIRLQNCALLRHNIADGHVWFPFTYILENGAMERQPNVDSFLYPFPVSNAPLNYLTSQDRSKSLAIKMREAYLVSTEVVICSISACTRGWERSRVLCPKTPQIIPNFSWRPQVNSPIQLTRGDIALKRLAAARHVFCIHTRICDSGNLLIFPPMSGNRR